MKWIIGNLYSCLPFCLLHFSSWPDRRLSSAFICPPGLYIFRDKGNLIHESRAQLLTCLEASLAIMDDPRLVPSSESNHDNTLCKLMNHRTTLIIYFTQKKRHDIKINDEFRFPDLIIIWYSTGRKQWLHDIFQISQVSKIVLICFLLQSKFIIYYFLIKIYIQLLTFLSWLLQEVTLEWEAVNIDLIALAN